MDLTQRCNGIFECSDGSDEIDCNPLVINKENYRKIFPPRIKDHKAKIAVNMDISSIKNIDEPDMSFNADLKIDLTWSDHRIVFKNLAEKGNFLEKAWHDQIWLPPLIFSNTEEIVHVSAEDSIGVKIIKQQDSPVPNNLKEFNEGNTFSGDQNELVLFAHHHYNFHCPFELSRFPFDIQNCSIDIQIPDEIKDYITLDPKNLEYSGKYNRHVLFKAVFKRKSFDLHITVKTDVAKYKFNI